MAQSKNAPPGALFEAFYLARAEAQAMVFSVRALFLVITYAVIAGAIGKALLWVNEKADGALLKRPEALTVAPDVAIEKLVELGLNKHLAMAMVNGDLPPLVLGVLFFSTFAIPWLILLVGYNRISEDVATKYTRYVLQRVHRGSYLAGKIVGHWMVSFLAIVVVHALLLAYGAATEQIEADQVLKAMPRIWLAMALFVLAYSTFTCMVSSVLTPPFLVLLVGTMLLFTLKFASWVLSLFWAPFGDAWIGSWDVPLWAFDPRAVAVYAGYSLIFVGAAYFMLRGRDL